MQEVMEIRIASYSQKNALPLPALHRCATRSKSSKQNFVPSPLFAGRTTKHSGRGSTTMIDLPKNTPATEGRAAMATEELRQLRAVQSGAIRAMLITHGVIAQDVEDDPEGYDGYATWDKVNAFSRALQETLFPNARTVATEPAPDNSDTQPKAPAGAGCHQ